MERPSKNPEERSLRGEPGLAPRRVPEPPPPRSLRARSRSPRLAPASRAGERRVGEPALPSPRPNPAPREGTGRMLNGPVAEKGNIPNQAKLGTQRSGPYLSVVALWTSNLRRSICFPGHLRARRALLGNSHLPWLVSPMVRASEAGSRLGSPPAGSACGRQPMDVPPSRLSHLFLPPLPLLSSLPLSENQREKKMLR